MLSVSRHSVSSTTYVAPCKILSRAERRVRQAVGDHHMITNRQMEHDQASSSSGIVDHLAQCLSAVAEDRFHSLRQRAERRVAGDEDVEDRILEHAA